ncbi:MAG: hypothetical protein IJH50_14175 [Kiritimatiellae bacterium]|nr:hypothetical protein [Kiritimatiellia bacterium]
MRNGYGYGALLAAFVSLVACGAVVEVSPVEGNATQAVRKAVARLKNGDTLRFAKGEYHFFEEGAKSRFLASVGSSTGMKKAVVHLEGLKDVTTNGVRPRETLVKRAFARFGRCRSRPTAKIEGTNPCASDVGLRGASAIATATAARSTASRSLVTYASIQA